MLFDKIIPSGISLHIFGYPPFMDYLKAAIWYSKSGIDYIVREK
jgi:hypothetical protein